jgi:prepilin-type N-terminal cleavage/methylation domain-containing protein
MTPSLPALHVPRETSPANRGFSLLELSVVLTIIGLLAGGVLAGRHLIKSARLRAAGTEFTQFQVAVKTFEDKYQALPGDMTNATAYWGRADTGAFTGQCAAPLTNVGTGTQTCNGDGNGRVGVWAAGLYYETFRFWQQLVNEGLVTGPFTGVHSVSGFSHAVIGENVPASRYPAGGWSLENYLNLTPWVEAFSVEVGNYYVIGANSTNGATYMPLFTPEEAFAIDTKMDDGKPARGNVVATWWNECTTAASRNDLDGDYDLANINIACGFLFIKSF